MTSFDVSADFAGQRLDRALAQALPGLSRTRAQAAISAGRVQVDGRPAKASLLLEAGMRVSLADEEPAPPAHDAAPAPPDVPLDIVYEDAHILVVNKAAGVVVHPAPGHATGTLVDALLAHAPGLRALAEQPGGPLDADAEDAEGDDDEEAEDDATTPNAVFRPGIVHRLDKDTSGLLVVAKDAASHANLAAQMKAHTTIKRYLALVEGQLPNAEGVIEAPIGRDPRRRQRMAVVAVARGGREARTRFRTLKSGAGRSLLELQLETGRTHQIRVHLAAVGHPVVGDPLYGRGQPPQPPRQFLHAAHLEFAHPVTGEWLTFDAPLPDDLAAFLRAWEARSGA